MYEDAEILALKNAFCMPRWPEACAQRERDRVALMLVDPSYVDGFLEEGNEYFFCQGYWQDSKLHALFCLLCELRAAREPLGYISRLQKRGQEMIEKRAKNDNIDQLGW